MEHSNKSSNSQVKKLGFEGGNGRKNLFYSSENPGAFSPVQNWKLSKNMDFIVLHKPFN